MNKVSAYAVKHKSETVRVNSRSGGVFTAISDLVLEQGGIVYGCVLDEHMHVKHIGVKTAAERDAMRGSKYVQSSMFDVFQEVKTELESNREVLFTGTPCQVAGLKGFLGKEYANLFTIDIICHGVPSPQVFRLYVKWLEKHYRDQVCYIDFRDKQRFGWGAHVESVFFKSGRIVSQDIYARLFYSHKCIRPSCYKCVFKNLSRVGDITLGDFWGIDRAVEGFDDNKGVSLILVSSDKGHIFFDRIKESVEWENVKIEDALQPPLMGPFEEPKERKKFWDDVYNNKFSRIIWTYKLDAIRERIEKKIARLFHLRR